ncbi:unnamed protein product [Cochlearia groenlandica]
MSSPKTKVKREESSDQSSLIKSLHEDVMVDIIARVPRNDYLTLSLVSNQFRSLVRSPELYARRSSLGYTQRGVYVVLKNKRTCDTNLYILYRNGNYDRHLMFIPSLPPIPNGSSFVAVGSKIYVFGGINNGGSYCVECTSRSHTVCHLPDMPINMADTVAVAAGIDKIYVFGYVKINKKAIAVFHTKTQTWEPRVTKTPRAMEAAYVCSGSVAMMGAVKMYGRGCGSSFVYNTKTRRMETHAALNSQEWWNACVVEGVLYYFHRYEMKMFGYDPKKRCWSVVNGLDGLFREIRHQEWPDTVSCCCCGVVGKLTLFVPKMEVIDINCRKRTKEIWCAEISLEMRPGGEIWGNVEWFDNLMIGKHLHFVKHLAVMN